MSQHMSRRLWWLAIYDPETGLATRVVGVLGREASERYVSWIPFEPAADRWRELLLRRGLLDEDPDDWGAQVDGVAVALLEVDNVPDAADLAGAVEGLLDLALVEQATSGGT